MTSIRTPWTAAIEASLGGRIARLTPVSGGDINEAYRVELHDGRFVFVKSNQAAPDGMFAAEARGLAWLGQARALRVPAVLAQGAGYLALELIEEGTRRPDHDELLGRGLAALHRAGAAGFGLDHDNFIGRLPQSNRPCATWAEFYRSRRIEPQGRMAFDAGRASPSMRRRIAHVLDRMEDLVGPPEPPARLHGDLWAGNAIADDQGRPCLIDPAAFGGHREVDLAMMRLFGGFGPRVFAAYDEAFPLAEGHADRTPLYQLYFLLAHVNMFGGPYVAQVEHALARIAG